MDIVNDYIHLYDNILDKQEMIKEFDIPKNYYRKHTLKEVLA